MRQQTLKNFLNIDKDEDSDDVSVYIPSPEKHKNTIPLQWTRVKNVDTMLTSRITSFDVERDLESD